jgi:hypothetical protein
MREAVVVACSGPRQQLAAYYTTGADTDLPTATVIAAMSRFPTEIVPKSS